MDLLLFLVWNMGGEILGLFLKGKAGLRGRRGLSREPCHLSGNDHVDDGGGACVSLKRYSRFFFLLHVG